jgi:hypothetical protein
MHEAGERRKKNQGIKVTGRSFYCKNNLKFKGRNQNRKKKNLGPGTGT